MSDTRNIQDISITPSSGELAIEDGSILVFDGDEWIAAATSEDRTEILENKVAELEDLVKRLISQVAPEMKL